MVLYSKVVVNKTKDGVEQTLDDVFKAMGIKVEDFTLQALDVHVRYLLCLPHSCLLSFPDTALSLLLALHYVIDNDYCE